MSHAQALFERRFNGDPLRLYSDCFKAGYLDGLKYAFGEPHPYHPPLVGTAEHDAFRYGQHQAGEDARLEKLVIWSRSLSAISESPSINQGELSCV